MNRTPFDLPEAESELVSGYNTEYSGIRWGLFFVAEYTNMFLISAIAVTAFLGGWQPSRSNIFFGAAALFFTFVLGLKSASYLLRLAGRLIKGEALLDLVSTVRPFKIRKPLFLLLGLGSVALASLMQVLAETWAVTLLFTVAKIYFFVYVIIWLRWTLPRIRIDQMMSLCWTKLVPIAFACILWTAFVQLLEA